MKIRDFYCNIHIEWHKGSEFFEIRVNVTLDISCMNDMKFDFISGKEDTKKTKKKTRKF